MIQLHNERAPDLSAYIPLPEDDPDLTPRQVRERRESIRRVSRLRYALEMTPERAMVVLGMTTAELMRQLELDEVQAGDLAEVAARQFERVTQ